MIVWQSNFNITDATVQLAVAYVRVMSFKNVGASSIADIAITDDTGDVVVKQYRQSFAKTFQSVEDIYDEILPEFNPARVVLDV